MQLKTICAAVSTLLLVTACQNLPEVADTAPPTAKLPKGRTASTAPRRPRAVASTAAEQDTESPDTLVNATPDDLWERLREGLTWEVVDNPKVAAARDNFLGQDEYLPVVAERSSRYLHYIIEEVEARGLPAEIALLPLVESTLNPFALSPGNAAGLWQIIPTTGRHLGLTSNWWYDGRRDLRDSTSAALDYLETLHDEFDGDWLLALAAYNSGGGRVKRAIARNEQRGRPTDYWSLSLPRETRGYVPKLLALASIVAEPEVYGATLPPVENRPAFAVADTGGQIELARAAELAGVDIGTLRALNPGQLRWATAPGLGEEILLPVDTLERFEQGIADLDPADRVRWQHYTIRRGDNLSRIARKFGTRVAMLKEVNKLRGSLIRAGDTLLIPQGGDWSGSLAMNGAAKSHDYQVKRGDSLYRIAGRFNVSVNDIVSWNSLDPSAYLKPGQQLTLYLNGDS